MNRIIIALLVTVTVVACNQPKKSSELTELKHQKDSLKELYSKIATQMADLDDKIAKLDTVQKARTPIVSVKPIEIKPFKHFFVVQGAVEAEKNALIYPETMGEIVSINVSEGQKVNKGDVIMNLDSKLVQSQIKELEKAYDLVKDIYERQEKLWNQKIGSEMQYLEAKNNKESMEQKLKTLKAQLDMYVIRAPFSGTIDEIVPKVGESASPQMPVARIINLDKVYVKADVSENYLSSVKEGTPARMFFASLNKTIDTKVKRAGDFISANNRTFKVRFDLNNSTGELIPNLLADIYVLDYALDSAVVIPSKIIQEDRNQNEYLYVLEGNKVKKKMIKTGMNYQNETVVLEGLEGKEQYIDLGARSVQDGDVVEVLKK